MDRMTAQALTRFGLGPLWGTEVTGDAMALLQADLTGPDPALSSPGFATLPDGRTAVQATIADVKARRARLQAGPQAAPAAAPFKSQARALYLADSTAQMDWAAQVPIGFRERLVWFWANHFTVSILQGHTAALAGPFIREAIRPHVTGNFIDMVLAAERHPAMLRYLANDISVGPDSPAGQRTGRGLNENLGRECLELHTVGLGAGYSQADVTSMAKLLTGWSIAAKDGQGDDTGYIFRPLAHQPGPQTIMGHRFGGGEQGGIDALTFLSRHPASYNRIAQQLAVHFVADSPPPAAVAHIAARLHDTGGDLMAAALAVLDITAAWSGEAKLKTPVEYLISARRAAPPPPGQPPVNDTGVLSQLGQPLWAAPLPNGWSSQAADWDGGEAVLSRIDWAYTYAARFDSGAAGPQPAAIAAAALGPLLRPTTVTAMAAAGSRREALTLLFAAPEFQRR